MYLTQAVRRAAQQGADDIATVCAGRERSWREFSERIKKVAGAMRQLG